MFRNLPAHLKQGIVTLANRSAGQRYTSIVECARGCGGYVVGFGTL